MIEYIKTKERTEKDIDGGGGNIHIEIPNYFTANKFNTKELKNPPEIPPNCTAKYDILKHLS